MPVDPRISWFAQQPPDVQIAAARALIGNEVVNAGSLNRVMGELVTNDQFARQAVDRLSRMQQDTPMTLDPGSDGQPAITAPPVQSSPIADLLAEQPQLNTTPQQSGDMVGALGLTAGQAGTPPSATILAPERPSRDDDDEMLPLIPPAVRPPPPASTTQDVLQDTFPQPALDTTMLSGVGRAVSVVPTPSPNTSSVASPTSASGASSSIGDIVRNMLDLEGVSMPSIGGSGMGGDGSRLDRRDNDAEPYTFEQLIQSITDLDLTEREFGTISRGGGRTMLSRPNTPNDPDPRLPRVTVPMPQNPSPSPEVTSPEDSTTTASAIDALNQLALVSGGDRTSASDIVLSQTGMTLEQIEEAAGRRFESFIRGSGGVGTPR